jgi:hypothetical protein
MRAFKAPANVSAPFDPDECGLQAAVSCFPQIAEEAPDYRIKATDKSSNYDCGD